MRTISRVVNRFVFLTLLLLACNHAKLNKGDKQICKVVKIIDGDTFDVLFEKSIYRIRLNGIDCPERNQPFGNKAKIYLSELCFEKNVLIYIISKDSKYKERWMGEATIIDGPNINQEMIVKGYAWHYKRYSNDTILAKLELEAKLNKVGLWQQENPIPPWNFRKGK